MTRNLLPACVFILSLTFCVSACADPPESLDFAASTVDADGYTDEWKRSHPDFAVFRPKEFIGRDTDNVHFLVTVTPAADPLAFWTQATYEAADNSCVVCSRSADGRTWAAPVTIGFNRQPWDHPDESVPANWVAYVKPIRDSSGRWLLPFTRWPSKARPEYPQGRNFLELVRFDNLDEGPNPKDLQITWLPEKPIAPVPEGTMEPCVVLLPDDRVLMVFRTGTDSIWYTVSSDDGGT